jgi:pilus assembly protein CpaE
MAHILVIDDELIFHKMVASALESHGYELEYAFNGMQGLELAKKNKPDAIIVDVMMPEVNGYEVTRLLRRDVEFAKLPIIILTAQTELQDKLKSFEAGADVYLTKPFAPAELLARLTVLLRRAEAVPSQIITNEGLNQSNEGGKLIAVHSLRGGIGCSSIAVNLAVELALLWRKPSILLDLTMMAGQVALMLNSTLKRTWADVARFSPDEIDQEIIASIISKHESGLAFIAAPTYPTEAETISVETLGAVLRALRLNQEYLIADLAHNFDGLTIEVLDIADLILLVVSPDMASIRAAVAALDTYNKLDYPIEKIKLVINTTFPKYGLQKEKIEAAISMPATVTIPYTPDLFVQAINIGQPLVYEKPNEPISGLLEDFAFHISKAADKKAKQENPTEAWLRVYKRFQERRK